MLVLASASKARHALLTKAGIEHCVIVSGVEEDSFEYTDPLKLVKELALAKAKAVGSKILTDAKSNFLSNTDQPVLGCDSVFVLQEEVLGKPRDSKEAIERWKKMSSNSGLLITGHALLFQYSLLEQKKEILFDGLIQEVVTTRVEFEDLTLEEIEKYVSTKEPMNCAGGFALEGQGAMYIKAIFGCYSNVIGLSLPWLKKAFVKAGLYR